MKRPEQMLADRLKEKKFTIALAESVTCGLAAHKLGTINGTSEIFAGSIICYSEKVKVNLLHVKKNLIKQYTAESQEVTNALAMNLSKIIVADVHAAVTGLAAPGASETKDKPVGTIFYAVLIDGNLFTLRKKFNGAPLEIREKACRELFRFIAQQLKE